MAAAPTDDEDPEGEVPAAPAKGGRRVMLIIIAGVVLLLGGGGAGAYFSGLLDGLLGGKTAAEEQAAAEDGAAAQPAPPADPVYHTLPDLLVSLNTGERRSTFLKVKLSLELASAADQARVEREMPRIIDYCQIYMRELRLDELRGSAGTTRLREELLRRIAAAVAPVPVNDVLFNEVLIQ